LKNNTDICGAHFHSNSSYSRLVDVISFDRDRAQTCAAATVITTAHHTYQSSNFVDDENSKWTLNELWLACGSGFSQPPEQMHIVQVNSHGWQEHCTLKSDILKAPIEGGEVGDDANSVPGLVGGGVESKSITSMCLVNHDAVWIGDNAGYIHAYKIIIQTSEEDGCQTLDGSRCYELLFSYKMEPDAMEEPSPVRAIHYVPELRRACVAMHNGRMFLCCTDVIPRGVIGGEGSFVMTELGSTSCIHSVTSIVKNDLGNSTSLGDESSVEIW